MVPLLGQIGFLPALIALVLYSMLPVLRNAITGMEEVDPGVVEAGLGLGMTPGQLLFRVRAPLALPVIVAGIRTATVWVVGTATLATPVGATCLGNYIFSGLQTQNYAAVVLGCVAVAVLAILLDLLIRALEVGIRQRRRPMMAASLVVLLSLYAYTGASFVAERLGETRRAVTIGSKAFTEQYILSELLAQRIADAADLPSRAVQSLGSTVVFDALAGGDVDLYVDYSGTIWATILERGEPAV